MIATTRPIIKAKQLVLLATCLMLTMISAAIYFSWNERNTEKKLITDWQTFQSVAQKKGNLISDLYTQLGYAGMIHHFKNAVLREDATYARRAEMHIKNARGIINQYRELGVSNKEMESLATIDDTISQYSDKIAIIYRSLNNGVTATDIDKQVRIDDLPATRSLDTLRWNWVNSYDEHTRNINESFHTADQLSKFIIYSLPFYLIFSLIIFWIFMRLLNSLAHINTRLVQNEKNTASIINGSTEAIITTDSSNIIQTFNPAAESIFGFSQKEVAGQNISILMPDEYRSDHEKLVQNRHIHDSNIINVSREIEGMRKNGERFPIEINIGKILVDEKINFIAICHDITQRKKMMDNIKLSQQTAEEARNEAEMANQAKSKFLSNMSHELRTPLNAILGFAQLLRLNPKSTLTPQQQENTIEIENAGKHLLELINQILDLAKIESGHIELNIKPVPLDSLLLECENLITPLVNKSDLSLSSNSLELSGVLLRADHMRLKQILLNLLSNACKYNKKKGHITIECIKTKNNRVRISIIDTGTGITPDQQENLFIPFNRMSPEDKNIEGTGIGLVITKQLVEIMGGTIGLDSQPGKGSTFWIELEQATPIKDHKPCIEFSKENKKSNSNTQQNFKVLYIEDNQANLRLVHQLLDTRKNISLHGAVTPEQGLEYAQQIKPDLILLDINLPGMNGHDVLKQLKNNNETKSIPVIAVSANVTQADIKHALKNGFDEYLTKPIDVAKFFHTIDHYLSLDNNPAVEQK